MKTKEQLIADFWDNYNDRIGLCFECCDSEKLLKDLENTLIKAIDQTREETIREVGDIVNKIIIKDYSKKWGDDVVDFAQDIVNRTTSLIKKELNKLKK